MQTERLSELAKGVDPSRLVSGASGWHDKPVGDIIDMHIYLGPGNGMWSDAEVEQCLPNLPILTRPPPLPYPLAVCTQGSALQKVSEVFALTRLEPEEQSTVAVQHQSL